MLQNPRINHAVVLKTCSESYDSKFQNLTFSRSTGSKRGRGGGGGPLPGGGRGLPALLGLLRLLPFLSLQGVYAFSHIKQRPGRWAHFHFGPDPWPEDQNAFSL